MELQTIGWKNAPGYTIPLWHNPVDVFAPDLGAGSRFRVIWVERGTGILRLDQRLITFVAPAIFCLNELERPILEHQLQLKAQAFYFHPSIVNATFTLENVRGPLPSTDAQDRDWLLAFVERGADEKILLNLRPSIHDRVAHLFATITQELATQPDGYWPCRSRSYFLELLFLIDRLCLEPPSMMEITPVPELSPVEGAGELLLYLHAHYAEKITLQQLSRVFHSNHTTLTQQFRKATGFSIIDYLNQLRIRVASLMLRDTTLPIAEIVGRVGFNDATHFGRTFRRYTSYTPSAYRQKFCLELQ
jgi:AraC family L-rhamnose operon regulatory protein RhaS